MPAHVFATQTRRSWLRRLAGVLAGSWLTPTAATPIAADDQRTAAEGQAIELSAEHLAAVARRRRIYVNNDAGYDAVMGPHPSELTPDQWIADRFSVFTQPGSQVDCVGWCLDEGNIAAYPSQVLPELQYPTLLRWRRAGVDLAAEIVRESHARGLEVFWEHRLNGADREVDVTTPARHPLKEAHPDWLIPSSWWQPGLWNFAMAGVREYKLAALREVAQRYDLDGLTLDFGRHPPYFPKGQAWELREHLTHFVRSVREMLQARAAERGRPMLLAVRVADTVPGCHFDGLDIETWIAHRLVDVVIVGTRSIAVDLAGFRQLTQDTPIRLYPCLDQHHSPDGYHAVENPAFYRGVAANWLAQGAAGIATFNFWNELPEAGRRLGTKGPLWQGESVHALVYRELGDPRTLAGRDAWFVVPRRYGGGFYNRLGDGWDDYLNLNHQAPLPLTVGGDPVWVELFVAADVQSRTLPVDSLTLRLQLSGVSQAGQVQVKFNGVLLGDGVWEDGWWSHPLTPRQVVRGRNLITLRRTPGVPIDAPLTLEKAEVHVRYPTRSE